MACVGTHEVFPPTLHCTKIWENCHFYSHNVCRLLLLPRHRCWRGRKKQIFVMFFIFVMKWLLFLKDCLRLCVKQKNDNNTQFKKFSIWGVFYSWICRKSSKLLIPLTISIYKKCPKYVNLCPVAISRCHNGINAINIVEQMLNTDFFF